jgi:ABC-type transport system involved in multi-copper enzyme maturation permease subunit
MIKLILFELRILFRDRWVVALITILAAACLMAFASGRALLTEQIDGRAASALEDSERLQEFRERLNNPDLPPPEAILSPYRMQTGVMAPLPPLADFSAGRAAFDNYSTAVSMRTRSDTLFKRTQTDNPEMLVRGTIDLEFVATILAPLLLIGLGYSLFATDRDSGIARLIMTQAGSPQQLVIARMLPRILLVVVPIAIAALALLWAGPDLAGRWTAAGYWALAAAMLLLFWAALIAWVNSLDVTAESAALALVAAWAVFTLVIPAAISALVQATYPPPSRFEQIAAARAAEVASTEAYENDHPDLSSDNVAGRLASIRKTWGIAQRVDAVVSPINLRFEEQLLAQQRFAATLSWLSPTMIANQAMEQAAGTDAASAHGFRAATRDYLTAFRAFGGGFIDRGETMVAGDFAAIPRFAWTLPNARPMTPIALLGLLALALIMLAMRRYARLKIT